MRIEVHKQEIRAVLSFRERARFFANKRWEKEAHRGVIDAGRKTKTFVQRVVFRQMGLKQGNYQRVVAGNTRGNSSKRLTYEIFGVIGGQNIQQYVGLRVLASSGTAARQFNASRSIADKGFVRSGVWNAPRTFKRSFSSPTGGLYAMLPGNLKVAPRILWTRGSNADQPRDAQGRFASDGSPKTYGKLRRLYGGSLMKEIPKDQSLAVFLREGPRLLEQSVGKRMAKLMRY